MFFASDNWAGAHKSIAERLLKESTGFAAAYGTSDLDKKVEARFAEVFERDVSVFFVATGTAANSLSLASVQRPGGITFCHSEAHVIEDECGAPEFFSGSARLVPVSGESGKIDPARLSARIAGFPEDAVHHGRATAVTITQATEIGTVYSLPEIGEISTIARKSNLPLHMDGARFANALVALGATPAEMTWKRGVDILSFGGTKNGLLFGEVVVALNPEAAHGLVYLRKMNMQLASKMRFMSAQFIALLEEGLWLRSASHANAMAARLRAGVEGIPGVELSQRTESNGVFAVLPAGVADRLRQSFRFYDWNEAAREVRWMCSFDTTEEDVDSFIAAIKRELTAA
jgi:threonine aldolase